MDALNQRIFLSDNRTLGAPNHGLAVCRVTPQNAQIVGTWVLLRDRDGHRQPAPARVIVSVGRRSWRPLIILAMLAACWLWPTIARSQYRESFEAPNSSWQLADRDCTVQVRQHARTLDQVHSGEASEWIQMRNGAGTFVHWIHPVPPSRVIDEWHATIWLKSNRPGLQLFARVTLPRSQDPQTGKPLRVLLRGASYHQVGTWERLAIEAPAALLMHRLPMLRSQFGRDVNIREAFIDLLVLNVYGGAGGTDVWLDDLEVDGLVAAAQSAGSASQNAGPSPAGLEPTAGTSSSRTSTATNSMPDAGRVKRIDAAPRLDGSVLIVAGRPHLIRMIEYQGEPFAILKMLGFNTIQLPAPPTVEQLREAEQSGMWLVAPPPSNRVPAAFEASRGPMLAWHLGDRLEKGNVEAVRQAARTLRGVAAEHRLPLVCQPSAASWQYSRIADILIIDAPGPSSSMQLADLDTWYLQRSRWMRSGAPYWAVVRTQLPQRVIHQIRTLGAELPVPLTLEPEQIRLAAYHAIASGARGLAFRSSSRLDSTDRLTMLRAKTLQWLNQELELYEPWVAAGSYDGEIDTGDPRVRVSALKAPRSRLLMMIRRAADQQYVVGPISARAVSFEVFGVPETDEVYRVSFRGMHRVRQRRGAGVRITMNDRELVSAMVLTQDQLAINHLARRIDELRHEHDQLLGEIGAQMYAAVVETRRQLREIEPSVGLINPAMERARSELQHFERLVEDGGHDEAYEFLQQGLQQLATVRYQDWARAARAFPSPVASPLCVSYFSLPQHYALGHRLEGAQWGPNTLPGGDFENLPFMQTSGWKNERIEQDDVGVGVELSLKNPHSGRSALKFQSWPGQGQLMPVAPETPAVKIVSAPIPVKSGQLVRIHGWVRVPEAIQGGVEGLVIFDSLAGPDLAERIRQTEGWQEFTLFRAATHTDSFSVTFALMGFGQAWIDDVTVATLQPPSSRPDRSARGPEPQPPIPGRASLASPLPR